LRFQTWEDTITWLRKQPDQQDLVRDCFYDDPVIKAAERYYSSSEWKSVRPYLPQSSGQALDIGAGRGISSYSLVQEGWSVTALEPDKGKVTGTECLLDLVKNSELSITVVSEYGENIPFPDNTFDLVYCRAVLHHAKNLKVLCQEAARVLRPGGRFIATREHVISRESDIQAFFDRHPLHNMYGGENAYLLSDYKSALHRAGFTLLYCINPFESDINLFPETVSTLKTRIGRKLHLPARLIPNIALTLAGILDNTPGRLYSFVCEKKHG